MKNSQKYMVWVSFGLASKNPAHHFQKNDPLEQGFFRLIVKHCSNTAQAMSRVFSLKNSNSAQTLLKAWAGVNQNTAHLLNLIYKVSNEQCFLKGGVL
jgi:hypothetical protein